MRDEIARHGGRRLPRAVRVRVPPGETTFDDQVHGPITIDHATIEDFVIVRSDGLPTYQLSVVCDDIDMAITHVIRGDDHISNTPKQIILYRALDAAVPAVRARAADPRPGQEALEQAPRRHGGRRVPGAGHPARSVRELPGAARLVARQRRGDLHARRSRSRASRSTASAAATPSSTPRSSSGSARSTWRGCRPTTCSTRIRPELEARRLWSDDAQRASGATGSRGCSRCWCRARSGSATSHRSSCRFSARVDAYDPAAVDKHLKAPGLAHHLNALADAFRSLEPFDEATTEATLRQVADSGGLKFGALVHATRIAVTGRAVSPGLFETLVLIGRDAVVARLEALARFLAERDGKPAEGA